MSLASDCSFARDAAITAYFRIPNREFRLQMQIPADSARYQWYAAAGMDAPISRTRLSFCARAKLAFA